MHERSLGHHTVSTVGLIHLLYRWSFCGSSRGVLRETKAQSVALEFLQALVGLLAEEDGSFTFVIIFSPEWVCRWPRPNGVGCGATVAEFALGRAGFIDMTNFFNLAGNLGASTVARKWRGLLCRSLKAEAAASEILHILELLRQSSPVRELDSLCGQVQWALSKKVERRLAYSQAISAIYLMASPQSGFAFRGQCITAAGSDLDLQLFRYVSATVEVSIKWNCTGISTDKG